MLEPPCVMLRSAVIFLGKLNFYSVISPQRVFRQLLPPFTFTHCTLSMWQHYGEKQLKHLREHSSMAPSLLETFSPPPPPLSYCVIIWHTSGWCLFDDIILGQALRICSYPVCCGFLSAKQTCKPYCLHCSKKVRVKYKNIFYI